MGDIGRFSHTFSVVEKGSALSVDYGYLLCIIYFMGLKASPIITAIKYYERQQHQEVLDSRKRFKELFELGEQPEPQSPLLFNGNESIKEYERQQYQEKLDRQKRMAELLELARLKKRAENGVKNTDYTNAQNEKLQKLKNDLFAEGKLLDDLLTVPSSVNFESDIIARYWKAFDNVIPEMFTKYKKQKSGEPYSESSIIKWISNQKPIEKYRDKPKK